MKFETFGEFLNHIIKDRKLSTIKLARLTGNKSKTSVIRLINNQCGYKTIVKFAEQLVKAVDFSEKELKEMDRLIKKEDLSPLQKTINHNLGMLFEEKINYKDYTECVAYNTNNVEKKFTLEEIFSECENRKSTIIIEDVLNLELIMILYNLIYKTKNDNQFLEITHFFKSDQGTLAKSMQIAYIMKLSTYIGYTPCECSRGVNLSNNIKIIIEEDDAYRLHLIKFIDENKYHYTNTIITKELYDYFIYETERKKENSDKIKRQTVDGNKLLGVVKDLQQLDNYPSMQLNSSVSFMMIPFHILKRLYEKSDYLGIGKETDSLKQLYSIIESRSEFFKNGAVRRKFVWTKPGLESFFTTGRAGDHFEPFSELTSEERIETMYGLCSLKNSKFRILKENYHVHDTEFLICEHVTLKIYDSIWGWWENFSTIDVSDKRIIKMVTDFYNNVIWEKYCYNDEESRNIVKEMIKKYS